MLDNFQTPTMEVCKSCAGAWVGRPRQLTKPMLSNRWRIIVATPWAPHQHHINDPAKSLLVGPLHNHPSCPIRRMDRVSHGAKSPHAGQRVGAAEVPLQ